MHRPLTRSSSIRECFPEEYLQLTNHSDIVVSSAQQFSWAGGYAQLLGGAGMLQKLPFRVLVGLSKNTTGKLTYETARAYLPSQQKVADYSLSHFVDTQSPEIFQKNIIPLLTNWPPGVGIDIHTLFECDWVDTVPFYVSIAAGILLLSGSLTPDFFILAGKCEVSQMKNSKELEEGLSLIWRIACLLENGFLYTPSIAEVAVCLTSARLPVVIQTTDLTKLLQADGRLRFSAKGLQTCPSPRWFMHKYDELYPAQQALPFEWGTLASGSHHMRTMHLTETRAFPKFGDIDAMKGHFGELDRALPKRTQYVKRKLTLMHEYTMHAIDAFSGSLQSFDGNTFLHALHSMHEISYLLQFHKLDHVMSPGAAPFKAFLKEHLRGNYKYLITEKGMRGEAKVFFAAPRHVLSGHMESLCQLYPEQEARAFEYLSWLDGFGNGGVEVEYTQKLNMHIPDLQKQVERQIPSPDIYVDCTRKKIAIKGQRVTSNDLRSQHFTVDLLHTLMQTEGLALPLDDLPRLSYLDTPNELQQKVLTPFMRAMQKYSGKSVGWFTELRAGSWWVCLDLQGANIVFSHGASPQMLCRKSGAVQERLLAS